MSTASLAESLPPELLEVILRGVVEEDHARAQLAYDAHRASVWNPEREKRFGGEWLAKQFLDSSTALLPCLLVCKHWFPIASKLLYHAVDLTPKSTDGEDEDEGDNASCSGESSAVEKAESFYETVSTRPALAALVMSLKIGGQPILGKASLDSHALATHSFLCIAALRYCTNVERLFISQLAEGHKSRLLSKMRILKKLRVLDVGSHSSNKCGIAVFSSSDCRDLSMAPALQVLGLSWAPRTSELPTSLVSCPAIRRLDLNKVAMTDAQFVATMARIAPTLDTLFISQERSGGFHRDQSWAVTHAALVAGLSHLTALEHLHVDISQEYDGIDLAATSPTLLAPLHRLKTVSISPDTFPCSGLGYLTSPHLQKFRLFVFSGISYPPIDGEALAIGMEAMLRTPASCPGLLHVSHQIAHADPGYGEDGEIEWEPEFPNPQPLDPEIIYHLTARCAEVGVTFLYSVRSI